MPDIGRPVSLKERAFNQITIANKNPEDDKLVEAKIREKLLNKVTGRKVGDIYSKQDKTKMGKDEFLKLLTHQLQNQDPLNPMEQGKMGAELAQFSQLEQLTNLNTKFEKLTNENTVKDKFYAASFVGKNVVTSGTSLDYKGEGTEANVLFNLDDDASKVLIRIHDKSGNMVAEMWKENLSKGNQNISWDGIRLDGVAEAKGQFNVSVHAWDNQTNPIKVETKVTGQVDSVYFENGEAVLLVDGKKVYLRDVDSFHQSDINPSLAPAPDTEKKNLAQHLGIKDNNQLSHPAAKLPIATEMPSQLNLSSKLSTPQAMKAYGAQTDVIPTTGLTDVYDVE